MIIGNNNRGFNKSNNNQNTMNNNFENKWNAIKENGANMMHNNKNVFVKNLNDQKYSSASNTSGMQDRTLAMLHERLEKGTISLEEFNKKCASLGKQRQDLSKKNKLF